MIAACIVGAGYSYVAGLPLASQLFSKDLTVASESSLKRIQAVWDDYDAWHVSNPKLNAEQYLQELFLHEEKSIISSRPPFAHAVELIALALSTPLKTGFQAQNPRYASRITQPAGVESHIRLWKTLFSLISEVKVITTNYDLLIERAIRHRGSRKFATNFYYGGFPKPQYLKRTPRPLDWSDSRNHIKIDGGVPIYKLHGSLNWLQDVSNLKMFIDHRPAFKQGNRAAIIPPVTEKQTPTWLQSVWSEAEDDLSKSEVWIVCGYSLPKYDLTINEMLTRSAKHNVKQIYILDPYSNSLGARYRDIAPNAEISCLSGLPEGIDELGELLKVL
jgi:hypothetical protein